ncbi:MAG: 30S ribosomal protein S10 [Endomicrobiia bacterium]|nr:30S ribosomal protein S10 [Endomicrobiia bacterium]
MADKSATVVQNPTKIRIKLKSFEQKLLDDSLARIKKTAENTGAKIVGPILLPTKIKKFTVLRSPHADKKSREQFEERIHMRLMDIIEPSTKTIDELMKLDLPAGVDIEIKY